MIRAILIVLVLALALAVPCFGGNAIWNSGFEDGVYVTGIPRSWHQETDAVYIPSPEMVGDAFEGKTAVLLRQPTPWHHQRPQYLWQRVPARAGRTFALSCQVKGVGVGYLYIQPLTKKGKATGKSVLREFGLCEVYTQQSLSLEIPKGAEWAEVRIGTKRIFTDLIIDAVSFDFASAKVETPSAVAQGLNLANIAPYATIEAYPPLTPVFQMNAQSYLMGRRGADGLVDGDDQTAATFAYCVERMGRLTFSFPSAVYVDAFRVRCDGIESYLLRGDTDGDGVFDAVVARCDEVADGWNRDLVKRKVKALRFEVQTGKLGYRSVQHKVVDVEILTSDAKTAAALARSDGGSVRHAKPTGMATAMTVKPLDSARAGLFVKDEPSFLKGITVETWMFGFKPDPEFSYVENEPFKKMMAGLKELKTDLVWLFTPTWQYLYLCDTYRGTTDAGRVLMWPNDYFEGLTFNALKPFCDAAHKDGMKVAGALMYGMLPQYDKTLFFYPAEETSRYPEKKQRPSIIFGDHYKTTWISLLKGMMKAGCDGVSVCADEFYYKGHFLKTIPARMEDIDVYRKTYGYDIPEEEGDTLKYRQWVMMRHRGLGKLYKEIVGAVKADYPEALTTSNFMVPVLSGHLEDQCIDFPMVGQESGIDHFGSDYLSGYGYKYMTACSGWRRSHILAQGGTWKKELGPKLRPIKQSGTIIRGLSYGLSGVSHYRYNYIMRSANAKKGVIDGYNAADDLDRAGMMDATVPTSVAMLYTRNSEDWYQVRSWYNDAVAPFTDRAIEGFRGLYAHRAVGSFLMEKGVPFDMLFIDRGQGQELSKYKVLVLPFGYSLSKKNVAAIEAAVAKGSKLVMFEQQAPADEWGEMYDAPALAGLVKKYPDRVFYFGDSVFDFDATYQAKVAKVFSGFGADVPMLAETYGKLVEPAMLVNETLKRYYISVINWEHEPARCDLTLNVPAGQYKVVVRDADGFKSVAIDGKDVCGADDLKDLKLELAAGSFRVFVISRME